MLNRTRMIYYKHYYNITSTRSLFDRKAFKLHKKEYADELFENAILDFKPNSDWTTVRQRLLKSSRNVTPENIDSLTLNFCASKRRYDLFESYQKFLKSEDIKPNLATIGKYFKIYRLKHEDNLLAKTDEVEILNLYKELRKTYEVLDSITNEQVILALSTTSHWKECLRLLKEIKIGGTPNAAAYSATVAAAFLNNDNKVAWQLLEEMIEKNKIPISQTYIAYLQQISGSTPPADAVDKLNQLFNFFSYHDLKCDKDLADKIGEVTKMMGKNAAITEISREGTCVHCKKKLRNVHLSEDEFDELRAAFFDKVIIGKNVFNKTTPAELKRFQDFAENMRKFDVVLDGLNIAYSVGTKQPPYVLSMLLASVVRYFVQQGKTVLVLGRGHMTRWPRQNWNYVTTNATIFLTENLSQDDPYILYCALSSGFNTILVSRDLMRSHLYLLKDVHQRKLFSRWLSQSRHEFMHVNTQGKPFFKVPLPYMVTSQKDGNHWHIPCEDIFPKNTFSNCEEKKWLCLEL